jgi:hypothetical protein
MQLPLLHCLQVQRLSFVEIPFVVRNLREIVKNCD